MDALRLRDALDPSCVRPLVASLMDNPFQVSGVMHDNGFHKLTLGETPTGITLRAHIWIQGSCADVGSINAHNHRWCFVSRVLSGSITSIYFETVSCDSVELTHYTYTPDSDPEVRCTGSAYLREKFAKTFKSGDCYYMDDREIHKAHTDPGLRTVTLVARGDPVREYADVYSTRKLSEGPSRPRYLPPKIVTEDIKSLYDLL
jgi:hypothetical protein